MTAARALLAVTSVAKGFVPLDRLVRHPSEPVGRPGHEDLLDAIVSGRDIVLVMPAGAGTSLLGQVPALHLAGTTLVISPLMSLLKDHPATPGDVIFTTPWQIGNAAFLENLRGVPIDLFIVDDAHRVTAWGDDFRRAFRALGAAARNANRPPVLALSATGTRAAIDDIVLQLGLRQPAVIDLSVYRPNLAYAVERTASDAGTLQRLIETLRRVGGSGIVYTSSIKRCDEVTLQLAAEGFAAGKYHGRLAAKVRHITQARFMRGDLKVLVATSAFAPRIDKPDIRFVIHYDMPGSLEAYYRESVRSGRDGEPAACLLMYRADTVAKAHASRQDVDRARLERMQQYAEAGSCRWTILLEHFGEDAGFQQCGICDNCLSPVEDHQRGSELCFPASDGR